MPSERVYPPIHTRDREPAAGLSSLSEGEYLFDRGLADPFRWTDARSSFQDLLFGRAMCVAPQFGHSDLFPCRRRSAELAACKSRSGSSRGSATRLRPSQNVDAPCVVTEAARGGAAFAGEAASLLCSAETDASRDAIMSSARPTGPAAAENVASPFLPSRFSTAPSWDSLNTGASETFV